MEIAACAVACRQLLQVDRASEVCLPLEKITIFRRTDLDTIRKFTVLCPTDYNCCKMMIFIMVIFTIVTDHNLQRFQLILYIPKLYFDKMYDV